MQPMRSCLHREIARSKAGRSRANTCCTHAVALCFAGERQELSELLDSANHKANMMQAANSLHGTHEATLKDKVSTAPNSISLLLEAALRMVVVSAYKMELATR